MHELKYQICFNIFFLFPNLLVKERWGDKIIAREKAGQL